MRILYLAVAEIFDDIDKDQICVYSYVWSRGVVFFMVAFTYIICVIVKLVFAVGTTLVLPVCIKTLLEVQVFHYSFK